MSPPLARAFARIASTLFALAALVLIGFATSPAGFAAAGPPLSLLAQEEGAAPAEPEAREIAGEAEEPPSHEATLPGGWQIAERPLAVWSRAASHLGAATALPGPDRPPPRVRSDLRSGSLGML